MGPERERTEKDWRAAERGARHASLLKYKASPFFVSRTAATGARCSVSCGGGDDGFNMAGEEGEGEGEEEEEEEEKEEEERLG